MSILTQNSTNEVALLDCIQRFFSRHHVGELLKKCNGTKEKGVPAISLLRYKLGNIFAGRSMYMQQRTGSFRVAGYLDTAGMPDPDLVIRTSGEFRISNYLLWQSAYAEYYITPVLWPDFTKEELLKAIDSFNSRERRFGGRKK